MNLSEFIKMQMASKAFNSPYCNPNFLNDFVALQQILEGHVPDELIQAEQFWFYCTCSFTLIEDAFHYYFHNMGLGHKW